MTPNPKFLQYPKLFAAPGRMSPGLLQFQPILLAPGFAKLWKTKMRANGEAVRKSVMPLVARCLKARAAVAAFILILSALQFPFDTDAPLSDAKSAHSALLH